MKIFVLIVGFLIPIGALAQQTCTPQITLATPKVINALTIQAGESLYRIADIKLNSSHDEQQARSILEKLLQSQTLLKAGSLHQKDRYGREVRTIFIGEVPLAHFLLIEGLAHVNLANKECMNILLSSEKQARDNTKGMWQKAHSPLDKEIFTANIGQYITARGQVYSVRKGNYGTFINFTYDFRNSLSAFVPKLYEKNFSNLTSLRGKTVTIRGVITKSQTVQMQLKETHQLMIDEISLKN